MINVELFKALFLTAAIEWVIITILFTARFGLAITRKEGRVPFVVGQLIIGGTNLFQAIAYTEYLYFSQNNDTWGEILTYSIPLVLIFKGAAYAMVTLWVFNSTVETRPVDA